MNNFMEGFWKGMNAFGPVAGGTIGGMVIMKGALTDEMVGVVLGSIAVIVNMIVNKIIQE